MLLTAYGVRGDEAGEMDRASYEHDCHAVELDFVLEEVGTT